MKDIQNQSDSRRIDIRKVGVKTVSYPIVLLDKAHSRQHTVATVNMYVNLPHHFKGTHMSRFVEILGACHGEIDLPNFHVILEKMKERLQAKASHLEMFFPYFLQRDKVNASLPIKYECGFIGSLTDECDIRLTLTIPVFNSGADRFGRRGHIDISVSFKKFLWIEDIISLIEERIVCLQNQEKEFSASLLAREVGEVLSQKEEIVEYDLTAHHYCNDYTSLARVRS